MLFRQTIVAASAVLYWGGVVLNIRRIKRRLGKSPNVRPRGPKEWGLWLGWFLVIAGWVGQPILIGGFSAVGLLSFIYPLDGLAAAVTGTALILSGHAGTLWCYAALGDAWRMGVDRRERTGLVTGGPYGLVRHPIYLFQIIILTGAMFLLPTPLSMLIIGVHFTCVLVKSLDEEAHLMRVHGSAYRVYCERTGRLLPKLRSLRLFF
ncbi:MAG: methyltransferase family protein [Chloroflexota bacterium]